MHRRCCISFSQGTSAKPDAASVDFSEATLAKACLQRRDSSPPKLHIVRQQTQPASLSNLSYSNSPYFNFPPYSNPSYLSPSLRTAICHTLSRPSLLYLRNIIVPSSFPYAVADTASTVYCDSVSLYSPILVIEFLLIYSAKSR
jgi:hypothetical protein